MGLFDSLRGKLKGVSKKLEDELEKELGDQLEKELQAAVAKEQPKPAATTPPAPSGLPPTTAPPPAPTPVVPAPASPVPAHHELPVAPPATRPTEVEAPPQAPAPPPSPVVPMRSEPASHAVPEPATVERPVEVESARHATPTPPPQQAPPPAPKPVTPAPAPKPQPAPQPGKKLLSESEIEARLLAELQQSVQVQREVEQVVAKEAPAARFTINESVLDDILWDLEVGLLESDVALPVVEAIKKSVREQLLSLTIGGKPEEIVEKVLRTAIKRVLSVNPMDFDAFVRAKMAAGKKPVVIMFVGVNGTGKTTSIGRIAWRLKEQGLSVCMAAGDTFRAGAIEQLALHGERLGVTVIQHKAGGDPAAVAFDAIEHAKARNKAVVLLDTAGRMQNNRALMDEMDKVRRVANPDLVVFVGDSLAGNDAVEQARKFDEIVDIGGVILTKVDVDAKGGAALSVAYTINKPLLFVGVGQNYPDLKPFDADWLVSRLFGDDGTEEA